MRFSACVHSYNEADAVQRLLRSSLPAASVIREWVVLDHRSSDRTQDALDEIEDALEDAGMPLARMSETRDLSRDFTFADLRNRALDGAKSEFVMIFDADFILGADFATAIENAMRALASGRAAGVALPVPVIWDHLTTDERGRITSHGRVWWHTKRVRLMHWPSFRYAQNGKWEKLTRAPGGRKGRNSIPNDGSVLVSVNVKPADRIQLRRTMTTFMEDATSGRATGSWLEEHARGGTREGYSDYVFDDAADLTGVRLNAAEVSLP